MFLHVPDFALVIGFELWSNWQDECSFVSLRDVERFLKVMNWFYRQTQGQTNLFDLMKHDMPISTDEGTVAKYQETYDKTETQPQVTSGWKNPFNHGTSFKKMYDSLST